MSSRKVVLNGVTYVRSRDAARVVSLAPDYVSRLPAPEIRAPHRTRNACADHPELVHSPLGSMKHTKLHARVADLEEKVFGAAHD